MMKKSYLAIAIALATLTGCGGGGSSDSGMTSGGNTPNNGSGNTELKCDRGILLNSNLSAKSIFDEQLYSIDGLEVDIPKGDTKYGIYGEKISRDGQMLYSNYNPIYNITLLEVENDEQYNLDSYIVNSSGLYTSKLYKKQNNGWPAGYLNSANNLNISVTPYNDKCNLSALKADYSYKLMDISGKRIKDILPLNPYSNTEEIIPDYISDSTAQILNRDNYTLNLLLNSTQTFPANSYIYVPQSINYTEDHFIFGESWLDKGINNLDEWISNYNYKKYTYKKDVFGGYKVAYPIDENGKMIFTAKLDQPIEKDSKIYGGEWIIKGDILSNTYGISKNNSTSMQQPTGDHTFYNKNTYDFIVKQIQTYYK
ncbi:hypothetical protein KTH71_12360 [Acinetobacter sp. WU_MDCI_Axc73]|nr:hypothetical protein [Acinetobacter sp. WU_MDCI_Axc73]